MLQRFWTLREQERFDRAAAYLRQYHQEEKMDAWASLDGLGVHAYHLNLRTGEIRRKDGKYRGTITLRNEKHGKYIVCTLRTAAGPKVFFHHRLVIYAFQGQTKDSDKYTVDHIDGNPLNNAVWNLRYASMKEQNLNRRNKPGSYTKRVPFNFHQSKLPGEEFRLLPESNILVSSHGRIVYKHIDKKGAPLYKIRNGPDQLSKGYPIVTVRGRGVLCHRLVAHLFLGLDLQQDDRIVMHKRPHSTLDYSLANLQLGSLSDNAMGAVHDKTRRTVPVIIRYTTRRTVMEAASMAEASRMTGVNVGRICIIVRKKSASKAWSPLLQQWCTFEASDHHTLEKG